MKTVETRAVDPLLFGDGRPFGNEHGALAARSLPVPNPGTLAGFVRTQVGNQAGWDWAADGKEKALQVAVHGPILKRNGQFAFKAPADAVIFKKDGEQEPKVMCLRPKELAPGEGMNLPNGLLPLEVTDNEKPQTDYNFWSHSDMLQWLCHSHGANFLVPEKIVGLPTEERVRIAIENGVAKEGAFFTVERRAFESYDWNGNGHEDWTLVAKVATDQALKGGGNLGGERRLATIQENAEWPAFPQELEEALCNTQNLRLILATPAVFQHGWLPEWVKTGIEGIPVKIVSAAVPRRHSATGWNLVQKEFGPKKVKWMAPAGSVYFLKIENGSALELAKKLWLKPVSDDDQDKRDGYGLALWGVWNYAEGDSND
ncbi:MAG: type III-B CRISPR module-associated protein Cmr3 [Armatimonadetes bacterium]|nr:type III-B CRISPR module-associated protein Cmr3 [Armatimonadota bacterium]